jgi:hypothetical protein
MASENGGCFTSFARWTIYSPHLSRFRWSIPVYLSFLVDRRSVAQAPKIALEAEILERFLPQHPSRNPLDVHEAPEASP